MSLRHLLAVVGVVVIAPASASAAAGASGQDPVAAPIGEASWRNHPVIVAIRAIVEANEAAVRSGRWRRAERHVCSLGEGQVARDRVAYRDRDGTVRKYVTIEGTDDSVYKLEHQFDEKGRLRFVFGTSGAVNGAVVEYRLYFAPDGALICRDRRETGPGYTFVDGFPEASVVRDPGRDWSAPARCSAGAPGQAGPMAPPRGRRGQRRGTTGA